MQTADIQEELLRAGSAYLESLATLIRAFFTEGNSEESLKEFVAAYEKRRHDLLAGKPMGVSREDPDLHFLMARADELTYAIGQNPCNSENRAEWFAWLRRATPLELILDYMQLLKYTYGFELPAIETETPNVNR